MRKVLKTKFFERNVVKVAHDLIGKYIVREREGKAVAYKITETEAYDGPHDLACHASKGRTKRTEVLYGEAGHLYVYLIYGMHYLLNVVSDKKEYPAGVLIRAVEGVEIINDKKVLYKITGPGRVSKALGIDKTFHSKKASKETKIWFEDRGEIVPEKSIKKTARIGVDYAGPIWSKKKYRFYI